jgi:hypothetical protein
MERLEGRTLKHVIGGQPMDIAIAPALGNLDQPGQPE